MSVTLRVCLYDPHGAITPSLRGALESLPQVRIVGQYTAWAGLQEAVHAGGADAVAINLDDPTNASSLVVRRLIEVVPDIGIIGVSQSTNPQDIIAAMRAGCGQYVRWPIDLADLQAAVERIRAARLPVSAGSRRVCVIGSSGGAGTTTISCNLVIELAHVTSRRCAIADLNLEFGDVACAFDCSPKYSIADVCRDGVEIDRTLLETAVHELPCNVSVLARPNSVDEAREVTADGVSQALRLLGTMFPFTVIDLPRASSHVSAAALDGADRILVLTQLAVPFLRNATRIYECLLRMGANEERLEIVLNRTNANFERITPEEVGKHFGRPIFAIIPNDYRRVTASRDLGHPMMTDAPNSPARMAIQQMARALASDHLGADDAKRTPASAGLLSKLWKR